MKVLFDQGKPVPLRRSLPGHAISTAYEMGWSALTDGDLLDAAEAAGFEAIVTTDQGLRRRQNLAGRKFGALVLPTSDWIKIRRHASKVAAGLDGLRPGEVREVSFGG